jgi:SAM-dependent MidA family methyltransferase
MEELKRIIREEIKKKGPISFYRFMKYALYHPKYGYYCKKDTLGKMGDFFTNAHISLFGRVLAHFFAQLLTSLGLNQILEAGAGEGFIALDILNEMKNKYPRVYSNLKYYILEKSEVMKEKEKEVLSPHLPKVFWLNDTQNFNLNGIIFSNELFDSLPVNLLQLKEDGWYEMFVNVKEENFEFIEKPLTCPVIINYLNKIKIDPPIGHKIEVNLDAISLLTKFSLVLKEGIIVTFDYGFEKDTFLKPFFKDGTLLSYENHLTYPEILEKPGRRDITSHVNFSALKIYGKELGLKNLYFSEQAKFIVQILERTKFAPPPDENSLLRTLIQPEGLGGKIKVLIQSKLKPKKERALLKLMGRNFS